MQHSLTVPLVVVTNGPIALLAPIFIFYIYTCFVLGNIVRQPSIIYVQHSDQGTSYQVQYLQDDPSPVVSAAADATQLGEVATTAAAVFGDHSDYHVGPQGAIVTTQQTQQQF